MKRKGQTSWGSKKDRSTERRSQPVVPPVGNSAALSNFHLFLDIDGTLVHSVPLSEQHFLGAADFKIEQLDLAAFKRPGMDQFLSFCFSHFKSVSIWTAGSEQYAHTVAKNVVPSGCAFKFILSRDDLSGHPSGQSETWAKNLAAMWAFNNNFESANITAENSFIIDDTPEVCAWNAENAIIVPSWNAYRAPWVEDACFGNLIRTFSQARVMNAKGMCSEASRDFEVPYSMITNEGLEGPEDSMDIL